MDFVLPVVPYLQLKFQLIAERDCSLPEVKGSMLRGAFGHALKRTVCALHSGGDCSHCMLKQQCIYTQVFEKYITGPPPPMLKGVELAPKPFVIEAFDTKTELRAGDDLSFTFTLFGKTCDYFPYVVFAVDRMARSGLGSGRPPFFCKSVYWIDNYDAGTKKVRLLYDGENQCLKDSARPSIPRFEGKMDSAAKILFLTPTRLKKNKKYIIDFSFRDLVFFMVRRTLEIAHFYVPDAKVNWEFRDLLTKADNIEIINKNIEWVDWPRFSSRQKTRMEMGGLVGEIELQGPLDGFEAMLYTSQILHVGKGTSFGLGKMLVLSK